MSETLEERVQETIEAGSTVWFKADGRVVEGVVSEVDAGAGHGVQTDVYIDPMGASDEKYGLTFRDDDTPRVSYGERGEDGEFYWEGLGDATAYDL